MQTQTIVERIEHRESGLELQVSNQVNHGSERCLDEIDQTIARAEVERNKMKYNSYKENPSKANYEAIRAIAKKTASVIGNTLKYLVFWPNFIHKHLWATEDDWKNKNGKYGKDEEGARCFFTTASYLAGTVTSIGVSYSAWHNYSNGNIGIVPTLALNIGLFGEVASVIGAGAKEWFMYERNQAIENYRLNIEKAEAKVKSLEGKTK